MKLFLVFIHETNQNFAGLNNWKPTVETIAKREFGRFAYQITTRAGECHS